MRGVIRKRVGKRGTTWQVGIYLGRDPRTGKKRRKWYTYRTKPEAERQVAQLIMQVQGGLAAPPTRLLVRDYLEQWLRDDVSGRLQPTTVQIYTNAVRRYLVPALSAVPLPRLSAPFIWIGNLPSVSVRAETSAFVPSAKVIDWFSLIDHPGDFSQTPVLAWFVPTDSAVTGPV